MKHPTADDARLSQALACLVSFGPISIDRSGLRRAYRLSVIALQEIRQSLGRVDEIL